MARVSRGAVGVGNIARAVQQSASASDVARWWRNPLPRALRAPGSDAKRLGRDRDEYGRRDPFRVGAARGMPGTMPEPVKAGTQHQVDRRRAHTVSRCQPTASCRPVAGSLHRWPADGRQEKGSAGSRRRQVRRRGDTASGPSQRSDRTIRLFAQKSRGLASWMQSLDVLVRGSRLRMRCLPRLGSRVRLHPSGRVCRDRKLCTAE